MSQKKPQKKAPRNSNVLYALLGCKGGPMRAKQDRRAKDARKSWKAEVWS